MVEMIWSLIAPYHVHCVLWYAPGCAVDHHFHSFVRLTIPFLVIFDTSVRQTNDTILPWTLTNQALCCFHHLKQQYFLHQNYLLLHAKITISRCYNDGSGTSRGGECCGNDCKDGKTTCVGVAKIKCHQALDAAA